MQQQQWCQQYILVVSVQGITSCMSAQHTEAGTGHNHLSSGHNHLSRATPCIAMLTVPVFSLGMRGGSTRSSTYLSMQLGSMMIRPAANRSVQVQCASALSLSVHCRTCAADVLCVKGQYIITGHCCIYCADVAAQQMHNHTCTCM